MAEGLLGVVCAHVGHCWGHLSSLGLPAGGPGASTSCRDSRPGVGAAAGFLVQGVPDAPHCWLLHPTEILPRISEAYFKVLFSHVPKDVMQSIGPQAAAWTLSDPKEIWDLSGCRCRSLFLALFSVFSLPSASSLWGGSARLCLAGAAAPLQLRTPEPGPAAQPWAAAGEWLPDGRPRAPTLLSPGAGSHATPSCSACSRHEPAIR